MTELHQRFARLDEIETEDLWWEIEFRVEQDVERVPYPAPRPRRRLVVAGAAAVVVTVLIGVAFLISSLQDDAPPVVTELPSTTSLAGPTPTVPVVPSTTVPVAPPTTVTTVAPEPSGVFSFIEVSSSALVGQKVAHGITYFDKSFIMVGSDHGEAAVWRSMDGLTWAPLGDVASNRPGQHSLMDVAAYREGLVAVGESVVTDGEDDHETLALIAISPDGVTWEHVDLDDEAALADGSWISSVAVQGDRLFAAGSDIWISDNGYDWTLALDLPDSTHRALGVAASELGVVVVGQSFSRLSDGFMRWSADGDEWTTIPGPTLYPDGLNTFMYTVAATSDGFIAGGGGSADPGTSPSGGIAASNPAIWVSEDGLAWTLVEHTSEPSVDGGQWITGFADAGDVLVAVGVQMTTNWNDAIGVTWESTDGGTTWQRVPDPNSVFGSLSGWTTINDVLFHNESLIAVGNRLEEDAGVWLGSR